MALKQTSTTPLRVGVCTMSHLQAIKYDGNSNFVADKNATATIFAQAINQATKAQLNDSLAYKPIKPVLDSVKSPACFGSSINQKTNSARQNPLLTD